MRVFAEVFQDRLRSVTRTGRSSTIYAQGDLIKEKFKKALEDSIVEVEPLLLFGSFVPLVYP